MGSVTSLSSLFQPEEARKAARRVEDTISERQEEVERLKGFVADNTALIGLVQKLPDELHHDIMVPFGKAAFFPGRLVHTNEFMVLLGEGYYAERTSKQTVEILKRRGKAMDANVQSLKSMIEDLRAEASFFDSTAAEVAEGLVEIREEIPEDDSSEKGSVEQGFESTSMAENEEVTNEDDEYARLMARLDELEKEEQAAEVASANDEETDNYGHGEISNESIFPEELDSLSHPHELPRWPEDRHSNRGRSLIQDHLAPNMLERLNLEDRSSRPIPEDNPRQNLQGLRNQKPDVMPKEATSSVTSSSDQVPSQPSPSAPSPRRADTSKAFTGSIIERAPNFQASTASSQAPPSSQPAKPVSRFKQQRR
ncbi:hypothetical protein MLD38_014836 [Melastoma candidum]|uniref:Uncharacterized protein n=1 Tax=Melastoma candidum TaxID=119954 RepID=A0ACB9RE04_9MYRT|nr:hypothetical protein MLD38_014836 [Melastoma candidum]